MAVEVGFGVDWDVGSIVSLIASSLMNKKQDEICVATIF